MLPTLTPTYTPKPAQATAVNIEPEALAGDDPENISNDQTGSNERSVSLAVGLGLVLSISAIMVIRLKKRS
jgi:LPXTG-motif cell wall-anchored protein